MTDLLTGMHYRNRKPINGAWQFVIRRTRPEP